MEHTNNPWNLLVFKRASICIIYEVINHCLISLVRVDSKDNSYESALCSFKRQS